jgi:hypothetical protein
MVIRLSSFYFLLSLKYEFCSRAQKMAIWNNVSNIWLSDEHVPLLWKESLNGDGQQFHQYQQNKRKFKQW